MAGPEDLRVGLVGYGMAGRDFHAPLLRGALGLRVTHVSTSDPARRAAAVHDRDGVTVVPDFDALLAAADDLDLAVLASPSGAHVDQAIACVERGLPVVVDKPMALDASSGHRLVDRAATLGVPVTVFQNRRWDAEHLTAKALLASEEMGEVLRYEARYERWRPQPKSRWRENLPDAEGGGLLLDLQTHLVDQAVDLFGPVEAVYADLRAVTTVGYDVTFLLLHHVSGVRSHLGATSLAGAPGPRTRIVGRGGTYLVAASDGEPTAHTQWADQDDAHCGWLVRGDDAEPVPRASGGWDDFYPAVAEALRSGTPMPVDPRDAVAVLHVLDAARHSARVMQVVPVSTT